ncbi:hypothetical protein CS542_08660 [Pedobacter sp. IW39]|nr:hypothetical protein CS542_08660 [Pedobacter sp. IW39]
MFSFFSFRKFTASAWSVETDTEYPLFKFCHFKASACFTRPTLRCPESDEQVVSDVQQVNHYFCSQDLHGHKITCFKSPAI